MPRFTALLACALFATPALAQYDVEEDKRVWVRALLDVRVAHAGPQPSWTDRGLGKTRFGGKVNADGRFERATRVALAHLILEAGATLPGDVRAQVQLDLEHDAADNDRPWLIEATLRKEWGSDRNGYGLQTGIMNLPFSLEHTGPAWLPEYTLSASALNSWLWEDMNLAGVEAEWWHITRSGLRFGALAGAGYGPDLFGRLLALRGWALGDVIGGVNSNLALPNRLDRNDVYEERDNRPGAYTWLSVSDKEEIVSVKAGYFDNNGDQSEPGVWHTRFSTVGVTVHPHSSIVAIVQYLDGKARVQAPANDSDISSFYALLSHHYKRQRLSVRYDTFRIHDVDGGPNTNERGHGVTLSYQYQFGLRHRVALEHIWLDARREANPAVNPTPDGWQLSYRFRY